MSLAYEGITVICDGCRKQMHTSRHTGHGARGDAERKGWRVAYLADGMHPTKRSNVNTERDLCGSCRPDKPKPPSWGHGQPNERPTDDPRHTERGRPMITAPTPGRCAACSVTREWLGVRENEGHGIRP